MVDWREFIEKYWFVLVLILVGVGSAAYFAWVVTIPPATPPYP